MTLIARVRLAAATLLVAHCLSSTHRSCEGYAEVLRMPWSAITPASIASPGHFTGSPTVDETVNDAGARFLNVQYSQGRLEPCDCCDIFVFERHDDTATLVSYAHTARFQSAAAAAEAASAMWTMAAGRSLEFEPTTLEGDPHPFFQDQVELQDIGSVREIMVVRDSQDTGSRFVVRLLVRERLPRH